MAPSVAERRLVSVLFVDLVGFTVASESRDAEDTRELLVRYFEIARTTIESDEADRLFKGAAGLFRELAFPFYLAVTLLEHAEWLLAHDRIEEAEPMLAEGHAIFERLEARPWLERSASAGSRRRREVASRQEA